MHNFRPLPHKLMHHLFLVHYLLSAPYSLPPYIYAQIPSATLACALVVSLVNAPSLYSCTTSVLSLINSCTTCSLCITCYQPRTPSLPIFMHQFHPPPLLVH